MLVMKFGGSALVDGDAFQRAAAICAEALKTQDCVLAVVSAMFGVTDALEAGALAAQSVVHAELLASFQGRKSDLPQVFAADPDGVEVLALGEQYATQILAAACRLQGLEPRVIDPGSLGLATDDHPRAARPLPSYAESIRRNLAGAQGLILVPGFYGRDAGHRIRLLGRNASDLSAALIATAAGAEELQVVASVSGLFSADPALVPAARLIPEVSYDEVLEMARGGAPVLHPDAIRIARDEGLPVLLRDLGTKATTRISNQAHATTAAFRALVHREQVALIHLEPKFGVRMTELTAALFAGLDRLKTKPIAVLASSSSISLALVPNLRALAFFDEFAATASLTIDNEAASLELVGPGLESLAAARSEALAVLNRAEIPILMLAEPAGRHAVLLVLPAAKLATAARRLHEALI